MPSLMRWSPRVRGASLQMSVPCASSTVLAERCSSVPALRQLQYDQADLNPERLSWTMANSSADRNAERSFGENGAGPRVTSPAERNESIRLRVASVLPMVLAVCTFPLGAMTDAPTSIDRLASGMSAVMTTVPGREFSAIQSSAASSLSETTIRSTVLHRAGWQYSCWRREPRVSHDVRQRDRFQPSPGRRRHQQECGLCRFERPCRFIGG